MRYLVSSSEGLNFHLFDIVIDVGPASLFFTAKTD
jgi:hypothetical protein